ncbi:MAG: DNA polymerase III subunit delta' [Desulfovibrio sp.]|jgi:DNA polymerase-3 subunit delta'|nr:DNA polymerase III subunit delta' [Desulfovibrio sp.]
MDARLDFDRLSLTRFTKLMRRLGRNPPQVLLLEGGREAERLAAARYWGAICNCQHVDADGAPCLSCAVCRQIMADEYLDVHIYDGRISNKDDQDKPGPIRAFNIDNARLIKRRLHDAVHGEGRRVVVIMGLDENRAEAANAMLKLLEEPLPDTVFVLLAPQREQLLPTLVSRSFCLTLPWPDIHADDDDIKPWAEKLGGFLRDGAGFLDEVAARGAVDAPSAEKLLLACQKACGKAFPQAASAFSEVADKDKTLDSFFSALSLHSLACAVRWTFEAQQALRQNVTPARVLEALATKLFVLGRQNSAK